MGNKENRTRTERRIFEQVMCVARRKGGEARRNADRLSGSFESFDRPDILLNLGEGRIVGIEHFRVDQLISHGKKRESMAAAFSGDVERFRKAHEAGARAGNLSDEVYETFGNYLGRANGLRINSCVDDIADSLNERLYGDENRGHLLKLEAYRNHIREFHNEKDIHFGLLIEFHVGLEGWFLNSGATVQKLQAGEFPLSNKVYDLLERASNEINWLMLAFCPPYAQDVIDVAIVDCRKGHFTASMRRQKLFRTSYLGSEKNRFAERQKTSGNVRCEVDDDNVQYFIEKPFGATAAEAMFFDSFELAAEALNVKCSRGQFVASLPVQLTYELVEDSLKHKRGPFGSDDVCGALQRMSLEELEARLESCRKKLGIDI